jgi:hypothetical protein
LQAKTQSSKEMLQMFTSEDRAAIRIACMIAGAVLTVEICVFIACTMLFGENVGMVTASIGIVANAFLPFAYLPFYHPED